VALSVQLPGDSRAIDEPSRGEILQALEEIARAVTGIQPGNAFWDSMSSSLLQIDVSGFRIVYRFEPAPPWVRVIELQRIPRPEP
jgi:hypothetical protein